MKIENILSRIKTVYICSVTRRWLGQWVAGVIFKSPLNNTCLQWESCQIVICWHYVMSWCSNLRTRLEKWDMHCAHSWVASFISKVVEVLNRQLYKRSAAEFAATKSNCSIKARLRIHFQWLNIRNIKNNEQVCCNWFMFDGSAGLRKVHVFAFSWYFILN